MKSIVSLFLVLTFISFGAQKARANATKEFITSCTYGVLTGTLVGAATLAFRDQPGDNLQAVARGASLGLYLGIALGIYVTQVVPNQGDDYESELIDGVEEGSIVKPFKQPFVYFQPTFSRENKIDGLQAQVHVMSF